MPMKFPRPEETIWCPACKGTCGFCFGRGGGHETIIRHGHEPIGQDSRTVHEIAARFCRSCGYPIIQHKVAVGDTQSLLPSGEWLYPQHPTRGKIPALVRDEAPDLADDYDEAVACEPHSSQASILLLSRVLSQILIAKCKAEKRYGQRLSIP